VPSAVTIFDWTDASGDGLYATGANWWDETTMTSGAVPGTNDIAKFGAQNGNNWKDNCTVPDTQQIGALNILTAYTGHLQIEGRFYVNGTDGAQTPSPLDSTIDGGAWKYIAHNCLVDFKGTANGLGTQVELGAGQTPPSITAGTGDWGTLTIESPVIFTIDNTAAITAFQTEVDNHGTLFMSNTADIFWQPAAAGQDLINNTGALWFDGNGGSINNGKGVGGSEVEKELYNAGYATVETTMYTLGGWLSNASAGTFALQQGTFDITGYTRLSPVYAVDNSGTVLFSDATELITIADYHQGGANSLTEYDTGGGSATLSASVFALRIDAGTLQVAGASGTYGTFKIDASIYLASGTTIKLNVNGAAGAGQRRDLIMTPSGATDTLQVPVGGNVTMNISTDNQGPGNPANGTAYTVISGYTMDVAPNKNGNQTWGTITVSGGYAGGMWKGAVAGNSYVITANGVGTAPTEAPLRNLYRGRPGHGFGGTGLENQLLAGTPLGALLAEPLLSALGLPPSDAPAGTPPLAGRMLDEWAVPTGASPDLVDQLFAVLVDGL
jgi:hypothetical protein